MKADYVHKDSRTLEEEPQVFTRWIDPSIDELKKENQELKEEKQEWINLLDMFKNQQKKFIEYLEKEINKWHYNYDSYNYEYEIEEPTAEELLQTTLSKYKEIIGGKDVKE